jgi:exodeoxyribonuclease VII small subunit
MPKKAVNYKVLSAELDKLLVDLQNPATSLDEAMVLYKRGQMIIEKLESYLSQAENTVRTIAAEKIEN